MSTSICRTSTSGEERELLDSSATGDGAADAHWHPPSLSGEGQEPPGAIALDLPSPAVTTATMQDFIWYDKGFIVPGSSACCFYAMAAALVLFGIGYKNNNECGGS